MRHIFRNLTALAAFIMIVATLVVGVQGVAKAETLKVGVVDVEYIIHTSKKGKSAKAKLKKLFESKQKELDGAQEDLLKKKKEIEEGSAMASPEKKKALVMAYQQGLLSLQELYSKNQQELAKKEIDLMKPILKDLEEVLTSIAADEKYDIIMNRSEHGVLFARENFDMTKGVLNKLDGK